MCDRNEILTDMLRRATVSAEVRRYAAQALDNFGCRQLAKMQYAGVRMWPERFTPPPELVDLVGFRNPPLSSWVANYPDARERAAYASVIRTVVFEPDRMSTYALTHELAHAWDDVANNTRRSPRRLDGLTGQQLRQAVTRLAEEAAQRNMFRTFTWGRRGRRGTSTITTMYNAFLGRVRAGRGTPFDHFGLGGDRHDRDNPAEFYAEGYAVFHTNAPRNQALLRALAPELYEYLETKTIEQGISSRPNNAAVETELTILRREGL